MALPTSDQDDDIEIWPDMQSAVSIFFYMSSQWRWCGTGMAGAFRTGMDFSSLPVVAGILKVEMSPEVLHDLRVMEAEAMTQWNRK